MIQDRQRLFAVALLMVLLVSVLGIGCSEERKREAARIAAELDAKERGEVLPPETTVVDTTSGVGQLSG
ncbi:MAG: hypothetical protein IPH75_04110 [bacterium]|nr:hypothetical protein [bacterium]